MCPNEIYWWSLGSRLNSAFLVVGDWSGVYCFNINMARIERSIDMQGPPWEWNKYLLRDIWVARRFSAVRHWVHDVFIFNTSVIFVTSSSICIEPGVCPKVEHMEGYFFSPFFITFLFNSSTPSFSFLIYSFFQSYLRTSNSTLLELSLGRSNRLWRIIGHET